MRSMPSGAAMRQMHVMWSAPRLTRNWTVPANEPPVASIGSST